MLDFTQFAWSSSGIANAERDMVQCDEVERDGVVERTDKSSQMQEMDLHTHRWGFNEQTACKSGTF